jgi:nitrogen regulatory protein P-II 2
MNLVVCKLVTIIAEDELEDRMVNDVRLAGARGYTVAKVKGSGLHRLRSSAWEGENILLETLVSAEVANRILERLASKYFDEFGVTVFITDASVLRGEKYLS